MRHSVFALATAACLGMESAPATADAGPAAFLNLSRPAFSAYLPAFSAYLNVPTRPSDGGWLPPGNGGEAIVSIPPVVWGAGSFFRTDANPLSLSHPFGPIGAAQVDCPGICREGFGLPYGGSLIAAGLAAQRNGGALILSRSAGGVRPLVVPAQALRGMVR